MRLVVDIARLADVDRPFGASPLGQTYRVRLPDGTYEDVPFAVPADALDEVARADTPAGRRESAAHRVAAGLAELVAPLEWSRFARGLSEAARRGEPALVHVRSEASEVLSLPWELLPVGNSTLLGWLDGVLVRREWAGGQTAEPTRPPAETGGAILVAWSTAGGDVPYREQLAAIRDVCRRAPTRVVAEPLPELTLASLDEALERTRAPVLHLLAHGAPLAGGGGFGLALEQRDGGEAVVDGARLAGKLARHAGTLRLVVVCACESAHAGSHESWVGSVAQRIHAAGIASVVAPPTPILARDATALTEELYAGLLADHHALEDALRRASTSVAERSRADRRPLFQLFGREGDGDDTRPIPIRPYRGLEAFRPEHRPFFHGQGALVDEMVGRIVDAAPDPASGKRRHPGLQILAGGSGSGKSSLIGAGILPRLADQGWIVRVYRPGEARLARLLGSGAIGRLHRRSPARRVLVVVDQFEEIFARLATAEARSSLARALHELAGDERPVVVLLAFRLDLFSASQEVAIDDGRRRLSQLLELGEHTRFVSSPEARDAIERMIEEPARRVGLELRPGLTERLIEAAGRELGSLPLLQFCLDKLWERREGRFLTHEAYDSLLAPGTAGLASILVGFSDKLYAELGEEERAMARRIFLQLVKPGETTWQHSRRRMLIDWWRPEAPDEAALFDRVLEKLIEKRLVVSGNDPAQGRWVEVAHEALLRHWKTLHDWIAERRSALAMSESIRDRHRNGERLSRSVRRAARRLVRDHGYLLEPALRDYVRAEQARTLLRSVLGLLAVVALVGLGMIGYDRFAPGVRVVPRRERDARALVAAERTFPVQKRVEDPTLAALLLLEVDRPDEHPRWRTLASAVLREPLAEVDREAPHARLSEPGPRIWRGASGEEAPAVAPLVEGAVVVAVSTSGSRRVERVDLSPSEQVLWLTAPGEEPVRLGSFAAPPTGVVVGDRFAALSARRGMILVAGGEAVAYRLPGELDQIVVDPDERRFAILSEGRVGLIDRRDRAPREEVVRWISREASQLQARLYAFGELLVAQGDAGLVVMSFDGTPIDVSGSSRRITAVGGTPDGKLIAFATIDGEVQLLSRGVRPARSRARGCPGSTQLDVSEQLVRQACGATWRAWRIVDGRFDRFRRFATTPSRIVAAVGAGAALIGSPDSAQTIAIRSDLGTMQEIALSDDGAWLFAAVSVEGGAAHRLLAWPTAGGSPIDTGITDRTITHIAASARGDVVAICAYGTDERPRVRVWARATRQSAEREAICSALSITPDGRWVVVGDVVGRRYAVWPTGALSGAEGIVGRWVRASDGGARALVVDDEGGLSVADLTQAAARRPLGAPPLAGEPDETIAIAADGRFVAAVVAPAPDAPRRIRLWDLASGRERDLDPPQSPDGVQVAFARVDGDWLLAAQSIGVTLAVWNLSDGGGPRFIESQRLFGVSGTLAVVQRYSPVTGFRTYAVPLQGAPAEATVMHGTPHDPIVAAGWLVDRGAIETGSVAGFVPLDGRYDRFLGALLRRATPSCLSPEQRMEYLFEPRGAATANAATCKPPFTP